MFILMKSINDIQQSTRYQKDNSSAEGRDQQCNC